MLNVTLDNGGNSTYSPSFTNNAYNFLLVNGSTQSITVPTTFSKWIVFVQSNPSGVWVGYNATPAVPTSTVVNSSQQLNIGGRNVNAGDVLTFVSSNSSCEVNVVLYGLR